MLLTSCVVAGMILSTPDKTTIYAAEVPRDRIENPVLSVSKTFGIPPESVRVFTYAPNQRLSGFSPVCLYLASSKKYEVTRAKTSTL